MSQATKQALEEALRDHVSDEWDPESVVTDWVVVAATAGAALDDLGIGIIASREPMPSYIMKGLLTDALDDVRDGYYDSDVAGDDD